MNGKNTQTSMGKWSVAFAVIPLTVVFLFLLYVMIPAWLGQVSGEEGLCVLLAVGEVIYYGSHVVVITSLTGIGLAILAIYKTLWQRGLFGFLLNIATLCVSGAYLLNLYHKMSIDPDRLPITAYHGDYKAVEKLLTKEFDINRKCGNDTALSNAAVRGHEQIVELLLLHGADVHIANPLSKAAQFGNGNVRIAEMLLEQGADPNCLHSAIVGRHKEIVALLVKHNANVNLKDGNRRTPLHMAVASGDEDIIRLLISKGADVNAKNNEGETPLHVLVQSWPQSWWVNDFRTKAINILLDSGADIEAKRQDGKTPLELAAEAQKSSDAVKALLERGSNINNIKDIHVRFSVVPISMDKASLEQLVRTNAPDIHIRNTNGDSLLHAAVKGRNWKLVEILLTIGADINAKNKTGDTVLHWAMKYPEPKIVELHVKNGAEINARNSSGQTPLQILSTPPTIAEEASLEFEAEERETILEMLLSNGADIYIKDNLGQYSLELQQNWIPQTPQGKEYRNEVLKLMMKHKVD
jgi:ankyrin repeat protein